MNSLIEWSGINWKVLTKLSDLKKEVTAQWTDRKADIFITSKVYVFRLYSLIVKSDRQNGCAPECQFYDNEVGCYWPQFCRVCLSGVLQLHMLCTASGSTCSSVFYFCRLFARSRDQRRLVLKEGNCNISLGNVRRRRRRFLHDIFTTLLELRWRYHLLMFSCVFLITWILFAAIWYIILVFTQGPRAREWSRLDPVHGRGPTTLSLPCYFPLRRSTL